jgi:hypothetical protein
VKLRSAPLDDVFQELLFAFDADGRWLARFTRWLFVQTYRVLKSAMLLVLGWKWRIGHQSYAPIGHEPFNVVPEGLVQDWRPPQ